MPTPRTDSDVLNQVLLSIFGGAQQPSRQAPGGSAGLSEAALGIAQTGQPANSVSSSPSPPVVSGDAQAAQGAPVAAPGSPVVDDGSGSNDFLQALIGGGTGLAAGELLRRLLAQQETFVPPTPRPLEGDVLGPEDSLRVGQQQRAPIEGEVSRPILDRPVLSLEQLGLEGELLDPNRAVVPALNKQAVTIEGDIENPLLDQSQRQLDAPAQQLEQVDELKPQTTDDAGKQVKNLSVNDADGGDNLRTAIERRLAKRFGQNAFLVDVVGSGGERVVEIRGANTDQPTRVRSFEQFFTALGSDSLGPTRVEVGSVNTGKGAAAKGARISRAVGAVR